MDPTKDFTSNSAEFQVFFLQSCLSRQLLLISDPEPLITTQANTVPCKDHGTILIFNGGTIFTMQTILIIKSNIHRELLNNCKVLVDISPASNLSIFNQRLDNFKIQITDFLEVSIEAQPRTIMSTVNHGVHEFGRSTVRLYGLIDLISIHRSGSIINIRRCFKITGSVALCKSSLSFRKVKNFSTKADFQPAVPIYRNLRQLVFIQTSNHNIFLYIIKLD